MALTGPNVYQWVAEVSTIGGTHAPAQGVQGSIEAHNITMSSTAASSIESTLGDASLCNSTDAAGHLGSGGSLRGGTAPAGPPRGRGNEAHRGTAPRLDSVRQQQQGQVLLQELSNNLYAQPYPSACAVDVGDPHSTGFSASPSPRRGGALSLSEEDGLWHQHAQEGLMGTAENASVDDDDADEPPPLSRTPSDSLILTPPPFLGAVAGVRDLFDRKIFNTRETSPELFVESALHLLRKQEDRMLRPEPNFLRRHPELGDDHRALLVDWLHEVSVEWQLEPKTVALGINYCDRYLSRTRLALSKQNLQLLGITALMCAMKLEETVINGLGDFISVTANCYSARHLLDMERMLCDVLQYRFTAPTHVDFLNMYLRMVTASPGSQVYRTAFYYCEIASLSPDYGVLFDWSTFAMAAVALALRTNSTPQCDCRLRKLWHDWMGELYPGTSDRLLRASKWLYELRVDYEAQVDRWHDNGSGMRYATWLKYNDASQGREPIMSFQWTTSEDLGLPVMYQP
eukprot:TRINITY_DN18305_c0_g1_i1.p1 TRINITY_DN18305_c0_g1~~TRINITY_DN18305_c0_g1_i1.p1  ORF type:complete len:515 (+),score=156.12 TRINITY_DN18305_c0_g1_i1:143-1687(+)